jgi:hypothetical protein
MTLLKIFKIKITIREYEKIFLTNIFKLFKKI